jgi:predicted ATPase/Flp pilus assembly protein TadD
VGLPEGTVTFLFTDIEGSTALLREHGDAYADILSEHRRVLRSAFAEHGGAEVDTQGDAFFVAFPRASSALAAARDAQEALRFGPAKVRIGIHTGEPLVNEEGYVGMSVHRAARIAAAAHGGQVLLSQAVRELVEDDDLCDLGEHRLKDLGAPERLYQVGDDEFPPLRSLDVARTNLPMQATRFIGRKRELAEALALLREDDVRLLTLVGPGGVGKTRLALQLAAECFADFSGGAWFVPLADVREAVQLRGRVAEALSLRDVDGLDPFLRGRPLLLVLDNFEQITDAGSEITSLLAGAPGLRVVVSSRAALRVSGEQEYPVGPLEPDEATALFARRARSVRPEFELRNHIAVVEAICARLDRLPLAIELAAGRSKLLDPGSMLKRLDARLPLLAARAVDVSERQRTLRATIAWSYDLLDPSEQALFRRVSVFAGGFTVAASEAVGANPMALDLVESLLDKSLVQVRAGRFDMLATIREFAAERLREEDDEDETRIRHAVYFTSLGDLVEAESRADSPDFRHSLEELENVREAARWTRATGRGLLLAELVAANVQLGHVLLVAENEDLAAFGLAQPGLSRARRLPLLGLSGSVARRRGNFEAALQFADQALDLALDGGEPFDVGWALNDRAIALGVLGRHTAANEDLRRAHDIFEDAGLVSSAVMLRGNLALSSLLAESDFARAEIEFEALLERPMQRSTRAWCEANLACVKLISGKHEQAHALVALALPVFWEDQFESVCFCIDLLASIAIEENDPRKSAQLLALADAWAESQGIAVLNRDPYEVALRERTYSCALRLLGTEAFAAEQLEGRALLREFRPDMVL